jgi:hypothetical protein
MKVILIITTLLFTLATMAQEVNNAYIYKSKSDTIASPGKVEYIQSAAITSLLKKKIIVNKANLEVPGYRIQIASISGVNSKDKANKAKAEILLSNPDAQVYIVYSSPYFKVRIGDFRDKFNANYYLQTILKDYPFAFVVEDDVNIPAIEESELETISE